MKKKGMEDARKKGLKEDDDDFNVITSDDMLQVDGQSIHHICLDMRNCVGHIFLVPLDSPVNLMYNFPFQNAQLLRLSFSFHRHAKKNDKNSIAYSWLRKHPDNQCDKDDVVVCQSQVRSISETSGY